MKFESVTDTELKYIVTELENAKLRPRSGDFLDGFPWGSANWYRVGLEPPELENVYLFWNGIAWGRSGSEPPRTLKDGALAFKQIGNDPAQFNNERLKQVKGWLEKCRSGKFKADQPFLILAGLNHGSPFIILDGNHRAAAVLWWAIESGDQRQLPLSAWVGLSPQMNQYQHYREILQRE